MRRREYSLVGVNGNAYSVMGYVQGAMKDMKFSKAEIDAYIKDATSSDYNNLICKSVDMIQECNKRLHKK